VHRHFLSLKAIFIFSINKVKLISFLSKKLKAKEIKEKYLDKIIYQYDLKNFVKDGFSKKINFSEQKKKKKKVKLSTVC
jgi:type III restriction enzyme